MTKPSYTTKQARIAFAMITPMRVRILQLISKDEGLNVKGMCDRLGLVKGTISHHLNAMRRAGLIVAKSVGVRAYYSLNPNLFKRVKGGYRVDFGSLSVELADGEA